MRMNASANEFAAIQTKSTSVDLLIKLILIVCARQLRLCSPDFSRRAFTIHASLLSEQEASRQDAYPTSYI